MSRIYNAVFYVIMLCLIILGITVYKNGVLGRYDAFPFCIRIWLQGYSTCMWLVSLTFALVKCLELYRLRLNLYIVFYYVYMLFSMLA